MIPISGLTKMMMTAEEVAAVVQMSMRDYLVYLSCNKIFS